MYGTLLFILSLFLPKDDHSVHWIYMFVFIIILVLFAVVILLPFVPKIRSKFLSFFFVDENWYFMIFLYLTLFNNKTKQWKGKTPVKIHFDIKKFVTTLNELNEWKEFGEEKRTFSNMPIKTNPSISWNDQRRI